MDKTDSLIISYYFPDKNLIWFFILLKVHLVILIRKFYLKNIFKQNYILSIMLHELTGRLVGSTKNMPIFLKMKLFSEFNLLSRNTIFLTVLLFKCFFEKSFASIFNNKEKKKGFLDYCWL